MTSRSALSSISAEDALTTLYRGEWGRLLALLVARSRRLDLVEDALAEAFARAAARWPLDGVPDNPAGWLYRTASRLIIGRLRAEAIAGRKMPLLVVRGVEARTGDQDELPDERLQLILLACHPALSELVRPALALRLVVGMPTADIARLFLVSTPTMAARLTRAKRKVVVAGIPLRRPVGEELERRLESVARTIYLAFTAGYTPGSGPDLLRVDDAGEAVRLAEILHRLVPSSPLAAALWALLCLHHARRDARTQGGRLVTLPHQDRTRWHRDEIEVASRLLERMAPTSGYAEELRLQAEIARIHGSAGRASDTDWAGIAHHYLALEHLTGSPIVRLNRAVAVAEVEGPATGLSVLDELGPALHCHHRFHAVRADLLRRAGRSTEAVEAYRQASDLCENQVERAYLTERLAALTAEADDRA